MNRGILTRLERLESRVTRPALSPGVSIIAPSGEAWRLNFGLVGAKPDSGRTLNSEHSSEVEAEASYNKLLTRYPAGRDAESVLICIDV